MNGLVRAAAPLHDLRQANQDEPSDDPDFKADVLPILEKKCNRCHGEKRKGGKLDLRTVEAMLAGGASGPAIKPGNAKKSLLIELIHYDEMPPKKEEPRVTRQELELLRRWVDGGAKAVEDQLHSGAELKPQPFAQLNGPLAPG